MEKVRRTIKLNMHKITGKTNKMTKQITRDGIRLSGGRWLTDRLEKNFPNGQKLISIERKESNN